MGPLKESRIQQLTGTLSKQQLHITWGSCLHVDSDAVGLLRVTGDFLVPLWKMRTFVDSSRMKSFLTSLGKVLMIALMVPLFMDQLTYTSSTQSLK